MDHFPSLTNYLHNASQNSDIISSGWCQQVTVMMIWYKNSLASVQIWRRPGLLLTLSEAGRRSCPASWFSLDIKQTNSCWLSDIWCSATGRPNHSIRASELICLCCEFLSLLAFLRDRAPTLRPPAPAQVDSRWRSGSSPFALRLDKFFFCRRVVEQLLHHK